MRRYDKEFEFLSKVEDKTDISNERIKYSVEQVKELKEKHIHIPDEYTDYLMEIGREVFENANSMFLVG